MATHIGPLSGGKIEQLWTILHGAYDLSGLQWMLRIKLDQNLDTIAAPVPFSQLVFELLTAAERRPHRDG